MPVCEAGTSPRCQYLLAFAGSRRELRSHQRALLVRLLLRSAARHVVYRCLPGHPRRRPSRWSRSGPWTYARSSRAISRRSAWREASTGARVPLRQHRLRPAYWGGSARRSRARLLPARDALASPPVFINEYGYGDPGATAAGKTSAAGTFGGEPARPSAAIPAAAGIWVAGTSAEAISGGGAGTSRFTERLRPASGVVIYPVSLQCSGERSAASPVVTWRIRLSSRGVWCCHDVPRRAMAAI